MAGDSLPTSGLVEMGPSVARGPAGALAVRIVRAGPAAASLWVGALTAWYLWTATQNILHPDNKGWDWGWALAWVAYAAAVLLSWALWRRKSVVRLWLAAAGAAALTMILLSGQALATLVCLWMLATAWAWGDWLLDRLGTPSACGPFERGSVALPLGLAMLALAALALLLAGRMTTGWSALSLGVLTVVHGRRLSKVLRSLLRGENEARTAGRDVLTALVAFVFLVNLAWTLAPETEFDALNYHLAVPRIYAQEGRLVEQPYFYHSYFAHLFETLFALALSLGGQITARLVILATGVIAAMGVYALASATFSPEAGRWAAALFYTTPVVSRLSTTTYTDLPVAMFLLACLFSFVRWHETRRASWLRASGLLAGAALGTKLSAIYALPVLGLALVLDLLQNRRLTLGSRLKPLGGYALGGIILAVPWYALVYSFTGNPFYPLLNGIFKSPTWKTANDFSSVGRLGEGTHWASLLKLPFTLTFDTQRYGGGLFDGGVGLTLPVLIALGVALWRQKQRGVRLLIAASAVYLGLWSATFQYGRNYVPILPVVITLAVGAIAVLTRFKWQSRLHPALLGAALAGQVMIIPGQHWNIPERIPLRLAFGLEDQASFLSRAAAGYAGAQYLNSVTAAGESVLGVGAERVRYYLNAPLHTLVESPHQSDLRLIGKVSAGPGLALELERRGYRYLFAMKAQVLDPPRWFPYLDSDFLSQFARLEYADRSAAVYRLIGPPTAAPDEPPVNLLANPGFERLDRSGLPSGWYRYGHPRRNGVSEPARSGQVAVAGDRQDGFFQLVLVQPGATYRLEYAVRAPQSGRESLLLYHWKDASLELVQSGLEITPLDLHWKTAGGNTLIAPPGAVFLQIYAGMVNDQLLWFDDFSLTEVQP